ncbi:MAG TPA: PKD domain-containing protein [Flavobacteriales bacterium]|nr:PKD domain-containing protein [Flavobacteriales bacterium]
MKSLRYIIVLITISLSSSFINPTYSTHIIGGEMFYECMDSSINFYRFTVKLYRDCYSGVPPYDDPIYVSVYDSLEILRVQFGMVLPPDDTLENNTYNVCLYAPVDICVQEAVYTEYYILPPGRYTLTYQRCCRNQGIVNMSNSTGQGAGWDITIPDPAQAAYNSAPYYNNPPPTIICLDVPFEYDHSATDPDGDSLVYSFCTPQDYDNGIWGIIPNPSGPPSSNVDVNYVSPYNAAYPIYAPTDPFQIDPQTGWLTGTPELLGKYVVGICVSEYRNGVLLSTNMRDFQFNVAGCVDDVTAGFTINTVCGNTIEFNNTSWHGTDYYWDFGVPNTASDTSTQANPIYTYSDSGSYDVTLIVNKGLFCADSITVPISAAPVDFSLAFMVSKQFFFSPPFGVQFTNTTPNLNSYNYTWYFGDGTTEQNNDTSLYHEYLYNGYYDITLIAEDTFTGCTDTLLMEDHIFCTGGTIGIDDLKENNIHIHPNPTTGLLTIEGLAGTTTVYNIYGDLVATTLSSTLDLSNAAAGIYLLKNTGYQGKVDAQRVVKE